MKAKKPAAAPVYVRPSWKKTLHEALPYSVRSLLSAYEMARGASLYVEIPLSPPSVNHSKKIYRQKNTNRILVAPSSEAKSFGDMVAAACWGKRFTPLGVVGAVVVVESEQWVTLQNKVANCDADNPIKITLDSLARTLGFNDKIVWDVCSSKLFGRREATHVWLFDLGDVVTAVGANRI